MLGVVFFQLIVGVSPFSFSANIKDPIFKFMFTDASKQKFFGVFRTRLLDLQANVENIHLERLLGLLGGMLEHDPKQRISIQQVLAHAWFTQTD